MINLSTGAFYERATRQIGTLRGRAEDLQKQIGTGERLERSSDDPVAAARLRTLARSERIAEVDLRNSQLAEADLSLTDQTLSSVADLIIRARELAVQGTSSALSGEQQAAIAVEISGIRDNILLLANSRNISGHALFGGQASGAAYTDGPGGAAYVGTTSIDAAQIGEGQTVIPGILGPDVFDFDDNGTPSNLFAALGTLAAALTAGGNTAVDGAMAALTSLDSGLEKVTTSQTIVGARLNWIDLMNERRIDNSERVASEQADVGGADIAVTITRLQETLTVLEATQSSFVRLANLSLFSIIR